MERRTYAPAPSISVCEILERYEREVLPSHKGHQAERYRVQTLLGFFGGFFFGGFFFGRIFFLRGFFFTIPNRSLGIR